MSSDSETAAQLRAMADRLRDRHEAEIEAVIAEQRKLHANWNFYSGPKTPLYNAYIGACRRVAGMAGAVIAVGGTGDAESHFREEAKRILAERAPEEAWPGAPARLALTYAAALDLLADELETTPTWDADTNSLEFKGKVKRYARKAPNAWEILDSLQEVDWSQAVAVSVKDQALADALASMNSAMQAAGVSVSFHQSDGKVYWREVH